MNAQNKGCKFFAKQIFNLLGKTYHETCAKVCKTVQGIRGSPWDISRCTRPRARVAVSWHPNGKIRLCRPAGAMGRLALLVGHGEAFVVPEGQRSGRHPKKRHGWIDNVRLVGYLFPGIPGG